MKLTKTQYLWILALGLALRVLLFVNLPRDLSLCATDFSPFYAGGKLLGSPNIYDPATVFGVLDRSIGCHAAWAVWIKPPFYAVFMWPLAQLPFGWALWIWRLLGVGALVGFIRLWPGNRWAAAAMLAWSPPVAANFIAGQDVAFLLLFVAVAHRMIEKGSLFAAGLVFGLCAIKFHLFILLPVLLIRRKLWPAFAGLAVTGTALTGLSFAAGGRHWIGEYLTALRTLVPFYDSGGFDYPNLRCLFHGYNPAFSIAAAVIACAVWVMIRSGPLDYGFAAVITGGLLLTPHSTLPDLALMAPAALLAARNRGPVRYVALLLMSPLPPLIWNGAGIWTILLMALLLLMWLAMRRQTSPDESGILPSVVREIAPEPVHSGL